MPKQQVFGLSTLPPAASLSIALIFLLGLSSSFTELQSEYTTWEYALPSLVAPISYAAVIVAGISALQCARNFMPGNMLTLGFGQQPRSSIYIGDVVRWGTTATIAYLLGGSFALFRAVFADPFNVGGYAYVLAIWMFLLFVAAAGALIERLTTKLPLLFKLAAAAVIVWLWTVLPETYHSLILTSPARDTMLVRSDHVIWATFLYAGIWLVLTVLALWAGAWTLMLPPKRNVTVPLAAYAGTLIVALAASPLVYAVQPPIPTSCNDVPDLQVRICLAKYNEPARALIIERLHHFYDQTHLQPTGGMTIWNGDLAADDVVGVPLDFSPKRDHVQATSNVVAHISGVFACNETSSEESRRLASEIYNWMLQKADLAPSTARTVQTPGASGSEGEGLNQEPLLEGWDDEQIAAFINGNTEAVMTCQAGNTLEGDA